MNKNPIVSIVIPTYNSEKTLLKCLKSVSNQTYTNFEVIIVDNFSNDKTQDIADSFGVKFFLKGPERSSQVNFGMEKAHGKYIYRVDSDFILEPLVLEEAVEKCEREGYDAIAVHNTSDPTISFWSKVRKFERDCYRDDELNIAARFFKKEVYDKIGGFNESLIAGEDYDFHNRILRNDYKIGKIKAQEVHIGEPRNLYEIAKKHYYYGQTINRFIKVNDQRGKKQLNPIRSSYFKQWKEFFTHPDIMFGLIIYQFVRYFSAILGYLSTKVKK
jgi:glycosyltransferase involved in cell wall biosynthesis